MTRNRGWGTDRGLKGTGPYLQGWTRDVTRAEIQPLPSHSPRFRRFLPSNVVLIRGHDAFESPTRRMSSSPPSSATILSLPMPGTPAWRARVASVLSSADTHVLLAFWLFGEQPRGLKKRRPRCSMTAYMRLQA